MKLIIVFFYFLNEYKSHRYLKLKNLHNSVNFIRFLKLMILKYRMKLWLLRIIEVELKIERE